MKKIFLYIILFLSCFTFSIAKAEFNIKAKTVILQDYLSGEILYEKEPDLKIFPASMTKIMTTIIAFELLENGDITLDEKFFVSENAWRLSQSGYSSMFIMVGDQVSVVDLLRGIIVASGNDACVALAEGIAGTEEEFALMMTTKAKEIGMKNTNFTNSSGLNDPDNFSTVNDILIMSIYLIKKYPIYYEYFKETEFTWDRTGGDPIKQGNRNPLLYKNIGADGIKTGFLTVEKYSLASSMKVGKRRINAVASGFLTKNSRSRDSIKILNWGLRKFDTVLVAKKGEALETFKVWLGRNNKVEVTADKNIYLTVPKRKKSTIKAFVEYNSPIKAPVNKGDNLGKLYVYINDELIDEANILANESIKKANIFSRILTSFNYLVWGDV